MHHLRVFFFFLNKYKKIVENVKTYAFAIQTKCALLKYVLTKTSCSAPPPSLPRFFLSSLFFFFLFFIIIFFYAYFSFVTSSSTTVLGVPSTIYAVSLKFRVDGALGSAYLQLDLRPSVRPTSTRAPPLHAPALPTSNGTCRF